MPRNTPAPRWMSPKEAAAYAGVSLKRIRRRILDDSLAAHRFGPRLLRIADAQLWIVSTAGTELSAYLRAKVDEGRARCEMGAPGSSAYFGWSIPMMPTRVTRRRGGRACPRWTSRSPRRR